MEIKKWLGLRNTTTPERFRTGELEVARNVDIDNADRLLTRQGLTQITASALHSLYSNHIGAWVMSGYDLKAIESDLSLVQLRRLTSNRPVSYDTYGDTVYYTNGFETGRIVGRTPLQWGVTVPQGQPIATAGAGDLPPGRYLYALTFVRADGHESGTGFAGMIELTTTGGVAFSAIEVSTNPEVTAKILYLSTPNGQVMYRAAVIPNADESYIYRSDGLDLTVPLTTQFAGPPPAGDIVRMYNGVGYVVVGDIVYYSDPYNLELYRMGTQFLRFAGSVVMFDSVNTGLYVGTAASSNEDAEGGGLVWFLKGDRPDKFELWQMFDYGVIPGTAVKTDTSYLEPETEQAAADGVPAKPALLWASAHGLCVGFDDGQVKNLTEEKYSFPTAQRGAGLVKQQRGYVQYLAVLQGDGSANNAYEES